MPPRRGAIVVVQELLRSLRVPTKEPALSNGADAAFETTDHSVRQKLKPALFDRVHVVVVPPVRRIAPVPTTGTLGQVCVDFARPPYFSLVQKRQHHSLQGSAQLNSKHVVPSLRSKQLRHFNEGQALCNSGGKADMGILYRMAPFGGGPTSAVARNDVMLRPVPEPHSPIWLVEAVGSAPVLAL